MSSLPRPGSVLDNVHGDTTTASVALSTDMDPRLRAPTKRDLVLCSFLVLSFCYELQLVALTTFDRLNPRLFDIACVLAVLGTRWRRNRTHKMVRAWEYVTIAFVCAGVISFAGLLPLEYGTFSLFYSYKYVEAMFAIWVLTGFAWEEKHLHLLLKVFCVGMIFAGTWGLLQLLGVLPKERYLANGNLVNMREGAILATFGHAHFHAAVMGALGVAVSLTLLLRRAAPLWLCLPAFFASLFIDLFSGSRSGLFLAGLVAIIILARKFQYVIAALVLAFAITSLPGLSDYVKDKSVTLQRIAGDDKEKINRISDRIEADYFGAFFDILRFHGPSLLLVGGGFYAVPMPDAVTGKLTYRVGYGFHNIQLFPLEQAGLGGLIATLYFWTVTLKRGFRRRNDSLARGGFAIAASIFIVGWSGQIFYFGFASENMVVTEVALMCLLLTRCARPPAERAITTSNERGESSTPKTVVPRPVIPQSSARL